MHVFKFLAPYMKFLNSSVAGSFGIVNVREVSEIRCRV